MIIPTSRIAISNQGPLPLEDVQFFYESGKTDIYSMGTVAPNRTSKKRWNFPREGTVLYQFKMGDEVKKGILIGYVSSPAGEDVRMNIDHKGDVQITRRSIPYVPAYNSGES